MAAGRRGKDPRDVKVTRFMADRGSQDTGVQYCEACGRVVPATGTRQVDTRTVCLRCALFLQQGPGSNWPPPGYVWNGSRWRFDRSAGAAGPFTGYQPTEREAQWWCFLSWLVDTGRLSAGRDEGAELPQVPDLA